MQQLILANWDISTHSLTKRLTEEESYGIVMCDNFNSQPHEEADSIPEGMEDELPFISTHSLTKRLTALHMAIIRMLEISTHSLTKRLTSQH